MQFNIATGEHAGDLSVQVQLNGFSFPGFPDVLGSEIFADQSFVLSLNCDQVLSGGGMLGRIVVALRHKRFQLRLNLPDPRQCKVVAGSFCRILTAMNARSDF